MQGSEAERLHGVRSARCRAARRWSLREQLPRRLLQERAADHGLSDQRVRAVLDGLHRLREPEPVSSVRRNERIQTHRHGVCTEVRAPVSGGRCHIDELAMRVFVARSWRAIAANCVESRA